MGYLPEGGRLHTCYSPVRRSPTASVATRPLPLDLHVLSLSLAFILSQDQTLRCCYLVVSLLSKKNRCRQPAPNECCFLLRSGCPVSYCAVKLIVFCCTCLGINGTNKNSPYCSLVLLVTANVSKISLFFCAHRRYFRKASAKLRQFSELANLCRTFFHHFFTHST